MADKSGKVWYGTLVDNGLGEFLGMLGDAGESKSSGFLDGGVEFLEA